MEAIQIQLDNVAAFDQYLRGPQTLMDNGFLQVISKPDGMQSGRPCCMLTFLVQLPSGEVMRAQTVTSARNLIVLGGALAGRYGSRVKD